MASRSCIGIFVPAGRRGSDAQKNTDSIANSTAVASIVRRSAIFQRKSDSSSGLKRHVQTQQKSPELSGLFCCVFSNYCLGVDSAYRAGINAGATIDAGVSINNALGALLTDSVNGAGVLACCAVGAIVSNSVCHGTTS